MKTDTDPAKQAIKAYLDQRAATDPQFAVSYAKEGKNIDECFRYILGEASRRGTAVCMTDEEVFGLAVHYYDEDDITIKPTRGAHSVSKATKPTPAVELTDEEKIAAREAAKQRYEEMCLAEQEEAEKERKKKEAEQRHARRQAAEAAKPYSPPLFD